MSFECGQQRVMRLGWERPRSPVARPVLTNRMSESFTYGSVGAAGGNPGPYPAANAGGPRQLVIRTSPAARVAQFCRSSRREVASTTAERGLVLTQPCFSQQVF